MQLQNTFKQQKFWKAEENYFLIVANWKAVSRGLRSDVLVSCQYTLAGSWWAISSHVFAKLVRQRAKDKRQSSAINHTFLTGQLPKCWKVLAEPRIWQSSRAMTITNDGPPVAMTTASPTETIMPCLRTQGRLWLPSSSSSWTTFLFPGAPQQHELWQVPGHRWNYGVWLKKDAWLVSGNQIRASVVAEFSEVHGRTDSQCLIRPSDLWPP